MFVFLFFLIGLFTMSPRLKAIHGRMAEIRTEVDQLAELEGSDEGLSSENEARFAELSTEFDTLDTERAPLQERADRLTRIRDHEGPTEDGASFPAANLNRDEDPFDLNTMRFGAPVSEVRARSITAVEAIVDDLIDDRHKEILVSRIEHANGRDGRRVWDERGVIPGMVLRMGSPAYHTAFFKALAGREAMWTEAEREAMRGANEFRAYMSLTDGEGGYGVPVTLDPSLILTDAGSSNPYRQIARVVTITNDEWRGLSSAGVTAAYAAEGAEAGDNSPTFAGPVIPAEKAHAFVAGSIEVASDFSGLAADLRTMFQDAKDDLEAVKFTTGVGAGSNEPVGIATALNGTGSEVGPATAETLVFDDLYVPFRGLPAKARSAAARRAAVSTNGTLLFFRGLGHGEASLEGVFTDATMGNPAGVLGYPWHEASALNEADAINPAVTAENFILITGDWRKFVVVDRVGLTVEFIPHLFATANNRPSGQRGWYAYWRSGSGVVAVDHFRMLSVPTVAP